MQIIQTWDGTVQDRLSHETGQCKTDILSGWDNKGLMQIIQTWDGTVQDRYSHETGQYKTDIVTRRVSTRQIYSRDGTIRY